MKPPPPAEIRAEDELAAADVRVMLAPLPHHLLDNLGITDQDASSCSPARRRRGHAEVLAG